MNLLSFIAPDGRETWGRIEGECVTDFGARIADLPDLQAALCTGRLRDPALSVQSGDYRSSDITFLPVIPNPKKILCVGINYGAHAEETGRTVAAAPSMFSRFADTLTAHLGPILLPSVSTHLDFEGELAVVIGRSGRYIEEADALSYVAGYTCFNDSSIRDYQKHSVTAGKNFPKTGALGPWMATEGLDPARLQLETRLNGVVVQRASTQMLIYSVSRIIAFASQFTALTPGTIISTGTPEGVGSRRDPQLWMKRGDVVEVEISGIGVLSNRIEDERHV
ncbi:fumarylacetoacetate hydrolase family protein [Pseudorhizobium pelagicum]|uniref:Fumarylacetoacetase-like C-terminal domain-containing protein n=1 Tax=Pseudorhizobium pelagicum TaxID=1509405 RepID=A0A922P4I3_9HYPH|nr:fumarylacetoacetate hydrolase family protein [Pseudorhizobium pelagicum]KEQ03695.1 hypothetical protein GV67_12575 [Pseudorhizobium pelagicum]KEQ08250.1 hypothetical protein GV68_02830 [Pseudorhizobium pelagicum]